MVVYFEYIDIDSLCKEGKIEAVYGISDGMIKLGKEPDVFTYSSLMGGLCLTGKLKEAHRFFDSMVAG